MRIASLLFLFLLTLAAVAAADDEGFTPLFNGKDLAGWHNVQCAPSTWTVRDNMIISTGKPTGVMRTDRHYENFILELEYKHIHKGGNAGLFIWSDPITARGQPFTRSIEVQILDGHETAHYTSHGDIFAIHGATMKPDRPHPGGWMRCLPSEKRAKPAGEWNHYRVTANNGTLKLAVNGKEVSGGFDMSPRKGYICLESEGSECHFRNIKIKELPSSGKLDPKQVVDLDQGFRSLYTGVDFTGWDYTKEHEGHWKSKDWTIDYDGKAGDLWSKEEYGDIQLIVDWRFTAKPKKVQRPVILPNGDYVKDDKGQQKMVEVDDAGDSGIYLRGSSKSQVNMWCWPVGSGEVYGYRTDASMSPEVRAGVTPKVKADAAIGSWNRFLITMKGDRLTVVLNNKTVIENAQLPGVAPKGKIALQNHGDPIQFGNIYVRELKP